VPSDEALDLVAVFATSDPVTIALAKAALQSAGIRFVTQGEGVQDLLGVGRYPGGFNIATGPVQFLVARADARDAAALLADVTAGGES
jgi:hypothetical protein